MSATAAAVVATDPQVGQVMAYLRRVACNRPVGQPVYAGAARDKILGLIWAGLQGVLSRAVISVALETLVKQGKIAITKGPFDSNTLWVNTGLRP